MPLRPWWKWRGRTDRDESKVDVYTVIGANEVAQEPIKVVDAIGRGLREEPHPRARRSSRSAASDASRA